MFILIQAIFTILILIVLIWLSCNLLRFMLHKSKGFFGLSNKWIEENKNKRKK